MIQKTSETKHFKVTKENAEKAGKWYEKQVASKLRVYYDSVAKELIATDEADIRNLNVKDASKIARIFSADNIKNLMKGQWQSTPTVIGSIQYRGAKYVRAVKIKEPKPKNPAQSLLKELLVITIDPDASFSSLSTQEEIQDGADLYRVYGDRIKKLKPQLIVEVKGPFWKELIAWLSINNDAAKFIVPKDMINFINGDIDAL